VFFPNALTDGVPKVTEALRVPFWHFWHLITLGIQKVVRPAKSAKRTFS
jgi:hypothetical protein